MDGFTINRAGFTVEAAFVPHETTEAQHTNSELLPVAAQSPKRVISLTNLPLELLLMIYDYATCRDHLEDHHYPIRLSKGDNGRLVPVVLQPALLMVCTSLRGALSCHFHSDSSFHLKIETKSMVEGLRLQEIDDNLPYPLRLSNIKLTIQISELRRSGFDSSVLVEFGKKLFDEYRTANLVYKDEDKPTDLDWQLVCTNPPNIILNHHFHDDLQLLLDGIHKTAARFALHKSSSMQEFDTFLEKWLMDRVREDRTSHIRDVLRVVPNTWKEIRSHDELLRQYYESSRNHSSSWSYGCSWYHDGPWRTGFWMP